MVCRCGIQRTRSWLVSDRCVQNPSVSRDTMRFGSIEPREPLAMESIARRLWALASNTVPSLAFLRIGARTGDDGSRSQCCSPRHRSFRHLSCALRSATSKKEISRSSTCARFAFQRYSLYASCGSFPAADRYTRRRARRAKHKGHRASFPQLLPCSPPLQIALGPGDLQAAVAPGHSVR